MNKLNFLLAVLVTVEAGHHLVGLVVDIVNSEAVHLGTSSEGLPRARPLLLQLVMSLHKLLHIRKRSEFDVKCILLVDFLVVCHLDQVVDLLKVVLARSLSGSVVVFFCDGVNRPIDQQSFSLLFLHLDDYNIYRSML